MSWKLDQNNLPLYIAIVPVCLLLTLILNRPFSDFLSLLPRGIVFLAFLLLPLAGFWAHKRIRKAVVFIYPIFMLSMLLGMLRAESASLFTLATCFANYPIILGILMLVTSPLKMQQSIEDLVLWRNIGTDFKLLLPFRKILCLNCYKAFPMSRVQFRCEDASCNQGFTQFDKGTRKRGFFEKVVTQTFHRPKIKCVDCPQETRSRICPECGEELPFSSGFIDSRIISFLGAVGSGKSNYFAVLIDRINGSIGGRFNFTSTEETDGTRTRFEQEFLRYIKGNPPRFIPKTPPRMQGNPPPPLFFRLRRRAGNFQQVQSVTQVFYDVAGEDLDSQGDYETIAKHVFHSEGLIFLVDPTQMLAVQQLLNLSSQNKPVDQTQILTSFLGAYERQSGFNRIVRKPLAVTLTKIDVLKSHISQNPADCIFNPSPDTGKFNEEDMRRVSAEVKHYLQQWDRRFVEVVEGNFDVVEYFAVSAFGCSPNELTGEIPSLNPIRIADPLLWHLWKMGFIDSIDSLEWFKNRLNG